MAFSYGFYNSLNGDRKYDSEDLSRMFDGIIYDGVIGAVGDTFAVKANWKYCKHIEWACLVQSYLDL